MVVITTPLTTHSGVRDIFITENNKFALVLTFSGIEYVNLYTGAVVSSGIVPGGFSPLCIAADWTTATGMLYVGTSGGGVFETRYHPARAPGSNFTGSLVQRYSTTTSTPISNNVVYDLDARPGRLLIGTGAGVDFIANGNVRSTRALISGTRGVQLTESEGGYWLTASSVEASYNLLSSTGTGIIGIDFEYTVNSNPALPWTRPTDLSVSEGAIRAIAITTPSGVLLTEERPFIESTAQRSTFIPLNEFNEVPEPQFKSADLSQQAEFDQGSLYATTTGVLRVYQLSTATLSGTHPELFSNVFQSTGGIARDQLLVTGTMRIVRTTSLA
jgi:hypothetical protein